MPEVMAAIQDVWVAEDLTALCGRLDASGDAEAVSGFVAGLAHPPRRREERQITCRQRASVSYADQRSGGPAGLVGLGGNLAEWVADAYVSDAYARAAAVDPRGPAEGETRVQRGGSWLSIDPMDFRGAARGALPPALRLNDGGARCVAPLPADAHVD
jgi:formylglycine-generating enzyme required for sulfatase activity